MEDNIQHDKGYSTKAALIKLRDDIRNVIDEHKLKHRLGFGIVRNIVSLTSERVLLSGVAYTVTVLSIVSLVITYLVGGTLLAQGYLLWEALFLLILLISNILIAINEEYLYRNEIPHRVKKVLETLDGAIGKCVWKEHHYPHLCAPFSPCVILQWTYRDGVIVNLPWALLVEGDIIVLRPGQEVPGHCQGLQPDDPELFFGQIFLSGSQSKEHFSGPRVRTPHPNKAYRMCETPYLKNLKLALDQATARPVTVFEKQRYLCTVKILEGIVLPLAVLLMALTSAARHLLLPGAAHWTELYALQVVAAAVPLLQIFFPIAWVTLNCYGLARFKRLSETRQIYSRPKSCSISEEASDPLIQALSESNLKVENLRSLGKTFWNILIGREDMVARTANIVHVLGSLSALCCVDKKGILSWPNPTAEKVFFLRNSSPTSHNSSKTSLVDSMGHHSQSNLNQAGDTKPTPEPSTIVEVLDLTHDQNAPFRVEFDEQRWRTHLARLKPLGLAALLNTCAQAPRHTYAHFCAHLTCEAHYSEDLVPVTNRRCLCELAKQIGFTDSVTNAYNVQECLAVFRHLQADTIRRETRFVRSLHLSTRVKVPLPHMLAVLVKDQANQLQMLTQGTADIILDSCVDYWNGRDLTPISPSDRKKIIDFYQRNSLTAYCTAFAYKPLTRGICSSLAAQYLELPADSRSLYAPHSHHWPDAPALHFHSTDSLLFNEITDDDVSDADGYFDMQCNQVFIGMVTMQYQAQSDMVELIERLERACIRFVHFSKENELRSRVFSEKMGLESGKPGSPLSSQTLIRERGNTASQLTRPDMGDVTTSSGNMSTSRALSMSAPGAINLDHTIVKFDDEIKKTRHSITPHTAHQGLKQLQRGSLATSQTSTDSLLHDDAGDTGDSPPDACRSLSCLTDSTDHSAPLNFDMSNRVRSSLSPSQQLQRGSLATSQASTDSLLHDDAGDTGDSPPDACRSLSCLTDSTDHSAPLNFDMSNRVRSSLSPSQQLQRGSLATSQASTDSLLHDDAGDTGDSPPDACRSLSCLTDSTDHSAPLNFDMSNRVRSSLSPSQQLQRGSLATSQASTDSLLHDDAGDTGDSPPDACRSLSCLTDSTDHSAPLNFDMSNRAKLPRGIENIRPHIEQVDNVPLLVSLFTDCTAYSVHKMIQIMQDYGEVVCVMGSAANCQNTEIFMQADASIAVEPLYPVLCQKMPPYQVPQSCVGPIDLARSLNSIPCSLSLARAADVSLFALITMSRHFTMCLWNTTQFWICSACFLAAVQVVSVMCFGVGALTVGGSIWGSLVGAVLSSALGFAPPPSALMLRAATRPALSFSARMALFIFWCYACKFLPSIIAILLLYGLTLRDFCEQISAFTNSTSCWLVYPVNAGSVANCSSQDLTLKSWHGWGDEFYDGLYLAQHITLALVTLHLIVISLSFVHRHSSIWRRRFWSNRVWTATVVLLIIIQGAFSGAALRGSYGACAAFGACALRYAPAWPLCGAYAASLLVVFLLNELIKWQEIKADARNQRRARLDFGTKLGMNSPF